jgi:hypothetical protein
MIAVSRAVAKTLCECLALIAALGMIGLVSLALDPSSFPIARSSATSVGGCAKDPPRVLPSRGAGRDEIATLIESGR